MGIRDDQKQKRHEDILKAALDLFISRGYAATKISDIAERVGMSVGLLFHYFKSKEALYEELIELGISGPMQTMSPSDKEPIVFFEYTTNQLLSYIKSDPFIAKMFVLMNHAFTNEAAPPGVKEKLSVFDIYTPTVALIQKGQANGSIREGDPTALAIAYWCAIQGIAEEIAVNPEQPCPEGEWIVDIIRRKTL